MAQIVDVIDFPDWTGSAELLQDFVDGANAKASRVAPCLDSTDPVPTDGQLAEAKLVLLGAIKRWGEAGSGALSQQVTGPFQVSVDTRQRVGYNLWPSEISALQDICKNGADSSQAAFSITPGRDGLGLHYPFCDLYFGGIACTCPEYAEVI